tara:strand:- start:57 stop:299 length:243 start_codon:yes stop_codon:yes gene_type:complete
MNKHIKLVKKWLADPASVSKQELKDNRKAAVYAAVYADAAADAAAYAVYAAAYAADAAAYAAADAAAAKYWVERYEELTK